MAANPGKAGALKIGTNTVALMNKWDLDVSTDTDDVTAFGATFKSRDGGLVDSKGSAAGKWDMSDTNGQKAIQDAALAGTSIIPKYFPNATNSYTPAAAYAGVKISCDLTKDVDVSFDFQNSGVLTYA